MNKRMNCKPPTFDFRSFKSWRGAARSVIVIASILLVLQIAMFAEGLSRTDGTDGLSQALFLCNICLVF